MWGFGVPASENLAAQINGLHLVTCDHRQVKAYDFGFPEFSSLRDLLIIARSNQYDPDFNSVVRKSGFFSLRRKEPRLVGRPRK